MKGLVKRGVSLVEFLIVLVVLGILLGVGFVSLRSYQQSLVIREAAAQVATELQTIRQQARRQSLNFAFEATPGGDTYRVGREDSLATLPFKTLPDNVRFAGTVGGSTVTFRAPYGDVLVSDQGFLLEGPGGRRLNVYVVGRTGKVVVRAP
ncbi:prepilin-type N-terminal cleavage/methylation domain-containing protein [Meiothermus sp.]|uniref:prepilin-type N-terminal cleavage/methylation domain-containing protein n=1 Tax=Meiothermus sp. TaxID=1955249 RepID=UPI00307D8311